ncbi:SHOCT domain-containing protein [Nocardioides pakistanensis]
MTMVLYAALLVVGVTLLAITALRVLIGGIADSPGRTTPARPTSSRSAQRILEERYAAGELSTDEFQRRLRVLQGGGR